MALDPAITSEFVTIKHSRSDELRLHYLQCGQGDPVLLLHGWPTSSYLWRNVMPEMAATHHVVALDLPGFGQSDKPVNVRYSFKFFSETLDRFVDELTLKNPGLVVHDLGGPVGLYWLNQDPNRVSKLAILNTLVYPQTSWAVKLFVLGLCLPVFNRYLTSQTGIRHAMKLGVKDSRNLAEDDISSYQLPFKSSEDRRALVKSALDLSIKKLQAIAGDLTSFKNPVGLIYGQNDRILPDISRTMRRLKQDFPHADLTALGDCGHFLQEDKPKELGQLLHQFFSESR